MPMCVRKRGREKERERELERGGSVLLRLGCWELSLQLTNNLHFGINISLEYLNCLPSVDDHNSHVLHLTMQC